MASMYPVMPVLKTTSPATALDVPDEEPETSVPSSRISLKMLEQCVDERGYGRSFCQHNQCTKQHHYDDDRGHPELLAFPHESPKVLQKIQHQNGLSMFFAGVL